MDESADVANVAVDVIEIYVPARLEYMSDLYRWLDAELKGPRNRSLFRGFSLYEVNGAFRGRRKIYEERTIVVRLIFDVNVGSRKRQSREARIHVISNAVVDITKSQEEEIWIIRVQAQKYAIPRRSVP